MALRKPAGPTAREDMISGYLFIAPALIVLILFVFWPIIQIVWLSFHEWSVITPERPWVGMGNYRTLMDNPDFSVALRNTIWLSLGVVPVQTLIGLFLAVVANQKIRGRGFFRTAFYFPSISSTVVISVIFLWLYQQNGLINFVLRKLGLPTPMPPWMTNPNGVIAMALKPLGVDHVNPWFAGPSVALLSIMIMIIWTSVGGTMVIFLAGLQGLSQDVYEAAALDGATAAQQFWQITVPLLKPIIFFVVTLGLIGTFQVFDQIFVMSQGGPAKTTLTLGYLVYLEGFKNFAMGYASAIAIALFLIILVIYFVQRSILRTEQ